MPLQTKTVRGFRGLSFPMAVWEAPPDEVRVTTETPPNTRLYVAGHDKKENVILIKAHAAGEPQWPFSGATVHNVTEGKIEDYYAECLVIHPSAIEDAHLYFGAWAKQPKFHRRKKGQKAHEEASEHLSDTVIQKKRGRPRENPIAPVEENPPGAKAKTKKRRNTHKRTNSRRKKTE